MPTRLNVFLSHAVIKRLDTWRRAQENPRTRRMALRRLAGLEMDSEGIPKEEGDESD